MAQWRLASGSFSWDAAAAALAGVRHPMPPPPRRGPASRQPFPLHEGCPDDQEDRPGAGQMSRAGGLSDLARQVHRSVLAAFARTGQPPARSELERLARSQGAGPDAVLAELAATDVIAFTADGEIRAAYPFSTVRTPIRVSWAGGPAAYAMCAIDALGMSAMLGRPVTITAAEPAPAASSPSTPTAARRVGTRGRRWCPRLGGDACRPSADRSCCYINFFATARAARAWARRHPEVTGTLLTREGALGIGIAEFGTLLQQVCADEPLRRLGVGPDRLGCLALGGQVQPERADLGLESPRVQLLGLPGTRL